MKRRYLTDREHDALVKRQCGLCPLCNEALYGPVEADHSTPHAFRPDRKPDQIIHQRCHREKTRGDVKRIAKAKRLHRTFVLGERKAKRKIQSRGFDKRWRRRMDGTARIKRTLQGGSDAG